MGSEQARCRNRDNNKRPPLPPFPDSGKQQRTSSLLLLLDDVARLELLELALDLCSVRTSDPSAYRGGSSAGSEAAYSLHKRAVDGASDFERGGAPGRAGDRARGGKGVEPWAAPQV